MIELEPQHTRGFTLVEIAVAAVIFTIGAMAVLAIQWNALGGYTQSRDASNAVEIGQRFIEMLKSESQQWTSYTSGQAPNIKDAVYTDVAWQNLPATNAIGNSKWKGPFFSTAVDPRFSTDGVTRYCVYGRGETSNSNNAPYFKYHIAVVYPSPAEDFGGSCPSETDNLIQKKLDPSDPTKLELQGYRAVFLSTIIHSRTYLK